MTPIAIASLFTMILLPFIWLSLSRHGPKLPPGPRWRLPLIGHLHMLGPLPHRALAKLAQKYGPIMHLRLGQVPTIVVSSPQAAQLFLKQHDAVFASRPIVQTSVYMSYGTKAIAFTPYGDYWRLVRKITTLNLLTAAKVEAFEGLRKAETLAAVKWLMAAGDARQVVDIGERVVELIEHITYKMVVGHGKDKQQVEKRLLRLKEGVDKALTLAGAFNLADFVPFLAPLDLQGIKRSMKAVNKEVDEILESIIKDHLKEENSKQQTDILGAMLTLLDNPNDELLSSFNLDSVKAIMFDLFIGGIHSSSVTITWALASLLKHPRVMRLLQQELDVIVGRQRMVQESDLPKLSYLDLVLKETFRLYPPGPLLVPRESMDDCIINEYMIPKKSRVFINIWAIGRDPNVWPKNVEEFYPERFLERDVDVRGQHFELIPFGAGRRGCPGTYLALITVKLVLAQLVHCFDWELPNGMQASEVDMSETFGLTTPRANKLLGIPTYRLNVTPMIL